MQSTGRIAQKQGLSSKVILGRFVCRLHPNIVVCDVVQNNGNEIRAVSVTLFIRARMSPMAEFDASVPACSAPHVWR